MSKIYTSADQLIGKTPLLELVHIEKEEGPIDIDSLTPDQMKELLKKMMGQQ